MRAKGGAHEIRSESCTTAAGDDDPRARAEGQEVTAARGEHEIGSESFAAAGYDNLRARAVGDEVTAARGVHEIRSGSFTASRVIPEVEVDEVVRVIAGVEVKDEEEAKAAGASRATVARAEAEAIPAKKNEKIKGIHGIRCNPSPFVCVSSRQIHLCVWI